MITTATGVRAARTLYRTQAQLCDAPTPLQPATAYLGSVEIRNYGQGAAEELLLYLHASIRISKTKDSGGAIVTGVSTLHRDAQESVRTLTTAAGFEAENTLYRPYGEETIDLYDLVTAPNPRAISASGSMRHESGETRAYSYHVTTLTCYKNDLTPSNNI